MKKKKDLCPAPELSAFQTLHVITESQNPRFETAIKIQTVFSASGSL